MHLRTWLLAGLFGLPLACVSDLDFDNERSAIVNGQPDTGDPAVVALTVLGQQFCTGTLIRPRVVLTAAHCLHPDVLPVDFLTAQVLFGSSLSDPNRVSIPIVAGRYHPQWDFNNTTAGHDVGVVALASAGPATPVPVATLPFDNTFVGRSMRIVGYGITMANGDDNGIKREATADIVDFDAQLILMTIAPSGTCSGDSGGPALLTEGQQEVVAGIHSLSDCATLLADQRVDVHVDDFIQSFIDAVENATCAADGACAVGCPAPDPDCPCEADGFCTSACADPTSDPDCPDCVADGVCDATCASDPDCGPDCSMDGFCETACAEPNLDPDCGSDGGCGCRMGGSGTAPGWPWLGVVGLWLVVRRRRPVGC